jgi:hypothetical protein
MESTATTATKGHKMSTIDFIIAYEDGEIHDFDEVVAGFQELINSGMAWQLQGHYGRTAQAMIDEGLCDAV